MTDQNPTELQPTHEIYAYIDKNGEPMEMTDPEPVRIYGDELYTPTGDCVGVCRDMYERREGKRPCRDCDGTGTTDQAKNRHYTDMKTCLTCDGLKEVPYVTTGEKSGAKRWAMPNHDTTRLLRRLPDQIPYGDVD